MKAIKNQRLAQLYNQLRFTPLAKRRKQVEAAEKLRAIIDDDKEYPFEFVCFKITGFRPVEGGQELIKGSDLVDDLWAFAARLSRQDALEIGEQKGKIYTIAEMAAMFGVATKTIDRWRKKGLAARRFVFDDGRKKLGFAQSAVDAFVAQNPELVKNAQGFRLLDKNEKQAIIRKAVALSQKTDLSRYQIISKIASELGRAHETIRCILLNYEKANPAKRALREPSIAVNPTQAGEIYRLYKQGENLAELMQRFNHSKSSIYRIIGQRRAKALQAKKIDFIASDEFNQPGAMQRILEKPKSQIKASSGENVSAPLTGQSLHNYLQNIKSSPLLTKEQELELFRRYNYLKFLAAAGRGEIKHTMVSGRLIRQLENYLSQAEDIKHAIIEANLRLVVSIAAKHVTSSTNLAELVSAGNVALMNAVEKFDYTRGFRFSTYAAWAIAKEYARLPGALAGHLENVTEEALENVQRDLRTAATADVASVERARQSLTQVITNNLDEREQYVILHHFGLLGSTIKKQKKTLQQIGQELNLSKERVRQIELAALQKLRQALSPEQFELLTG